MRWCFLLAPLLVCHAQQDLPADVLLLAKIKVKMAENLDRLPNYTCSETIERGMRESQARKLKSIDTVRLEVALVDHHELYGWPGSNRIDESELSALVGGTIGNGDFGLLARSIFLSYAATFTQKENTILNGRSAIHYEYQVPLIASGYHLKVGSNEAVVGYHGSFWADPKSLDLIRLDLTADNIPEHLGLSASAKVLDYDRISIGDSSFLLPHRAELTMVDLGGGVHANQTTFHSCRQYSGESVLSFADPASAVVENKPGLRRMDLPQTFDSEISLMTAINSDETAVGDEVRARLERSIKAGHTIVAPKGAILSGRILQFHRLGRFFHVEMSFHSLDFDGSHADLRGRENTVSMALSATAPQLMLSRGASSYTAVRTSESRGPIVIEANRLKLPRGFLLYLRSRLVKSDKQ